MHALPSHPKNPLLLGVVVLVFALLAMLAAAPELGTLDFSIGGSGATPEVVPAEGGLSATPATEPNWVGEPLAPPLQELGGTR